MPKHSKTPFIKDIIAELDKPGVMVSISTSIGDAQGLPNMRLSDKQKRVVKQTLKNLKTR